MRRSHTALKKLSPFEMLYGFLQRLPLAVRDMLVSTAEVLIPEQHHIRLQDVINAHYDQAAMAIQHQMYCRVIQRLQQINSRSNI